MFFITILFSNETRNPEFVNHTHLLYGWGHSTNGNSLHVWLCDSVIISSPLINTVFRPGLSSDKRVLQYKYNPPEPDSREVSIHKESFNCPTSTQGPLYKCTLVYLFTVSAHVQNVVCSHLEVLCFTFGLSIVRAQPVKTCRIQYSVFRLCTEVL